MKLEKVGIQIGILCEKAGITRNKLCDGLCSESELALIEKGESSADVILFAALLERLGKSAERLTYILTMEEYKRFMARNEIEEALRLGLLKEAEQKFARYRRENPPKKKQGKDGTDGVDKILLMYEEKIKGILILEEYEKDFKDKEGLAGISACGGAVGQERLKKLNTSLSYLESAISRTMRIKDLYSHKFIECLDAGEKFLAMFEIENILLYLYIKQYFGEAQDQRELLFALYRYLERNMQDAVLRAQYLAKTGILLGCILLAGGDCAACVKMHEKIIGLNRECGMLVCVMPLLEQIIAACERLGDTGKAEWYKKQKENFVNIFQDSNLSIQCLNKLYYTCRMRRYFVEGRLIAAERKWKKMTQQELAEGIYQYCASISRIETGKENSGRKKFYRIMEKLGIDCTRYNGNLLTDEFCVLELDRDIERHLARGQYEEAGHELYLLERSVDMNEKCNQQLVLGLKNMEALRAGKIGTEEALENARELLEMTYHLENVEEGGERYRRVPFRNEMYLFNQICIILRKDGRIMEAVELMERMMRTYDATVEARNFHNKNIYLCAINLCQYLERVDRLEEAERYANGLIREKLIYGKILGLHRLYSTKFDVAEKLGSDIENRKKLLYQAYFLSDWCNVDKDSRILEKALKERFGN